MTRILLIDPSYRESRYLQQKDVYPHTGLLMLGTVLKAAGHEVKVIHLVADNKDLNTLAGYIRNYLPDIVGVTMVTFQLNQAYQVLRLVKGISRNILTVAGGPHPSAIPLDQNTRLDFMSYTDAVIRGEGEKAFLRIADCGIDRKYYQGTPVDINDLPDMDLSLTNVRNFAGIYPPGPLPSMPLLASRGCAYNCGFCSKSVFGRQVRFRDPVAIINELWTWYEDGIKEVFFQDDTFNTNLDYCHDLLDRILSHGLHKKMTFRARLRANEKLVTESLLAKMKRANFWLIFYGVESGSQPMLDSMAKGLRLDEIKRAFQLTRKAGIKTEGSFIIGMPGETEDTIKASLRFYHELKPDWCSFNRAIPFPGTEFEKYVREHDQLVYTNYEDYRLNETLVRTDALTTEQLEHWAQVVDREILRNKAKHLITRPKELLNVVKDAGVKGIVTRAVRMAR